MSDHEGCDHWFGYCKTDPAPARPRGTHMKRTALSDCIDHRAATLADDSICIHARKQLRALLSHATYLAAKDPIYLDEHEARWLARLRRLGLIPARKVKP